VTMVDRISIACVATIPYESTHWARVSYTLFQIDFSALHPVFWVDADKNG